MNKRPDITDATRQRFVDAFCMLYEMKPVEKITVKEIAALAGHNRVTFYQYFRDAYDILEFMENELLEYVQETIKTNIGKTDMFDQFEEVFDGILKEKAELTSILLMGANYGGTLQRCKEAMLPVLMEAFHLAENDFNAKAVLEFYLSGIVSLLKYKVDYVQEIKTADLGKIIKYILQNGILPQIGI